MATSTLKPHKRDKRSAAPGWNSAATDFQILGVRPREARLEVIRQALSVAARQQSLDADLAQGEGSAQGAGLADGDGLAEGHELHDPVARVVVAGYRLLDPRRRSRLLERVQLLLWTEDDLSGVQASWWSSAVASADGESARVADPTTVTRLSETQPAQHDSFAVAQRLGDCVSEPGLASSKERLEARSRRSEEVQAALELVQLLRRHQRQMNCMWMALAVAVLSCGIGLAAVTGWF